MTASLPQLFKSPELYDHQKKIIKDDKKKTGLWLGTGSGKTRIALLLARGNTLVICPKTQAEDRNWEREAEKLEMDATKLFVVSKEKFKKIAQTLPRMNTVIIDEAHTALGVTPSIRYVKRQPRPKASQLFEALEEYLIKLPPDRLYLVTATIIRSPMTVWAAARLLGFDFDFYNWRQKFYTKLPMPGREVFMAKSDGNTKNELAKVVQGLGYIGRIEEYIDMPEQIFKTVYVELTDSQKKRIKEIPQEFPDPLVGSLKKNMIENGCLSGNEFQEGESFNNQKVDKLLELSLEFPRIVILARYTAQIEQIATAFENTDKKVFILQGATKDRGGLIKEANECYSGVFIAQASMSSGWELPEWPVMVFASLDWSVVNYVQSIGRISRISNPKRNLYIHLVVKNGIDQDIYKTVVETKMDFHLAMYEKN